MPTDQVINQGLFPATLNYIGGGQMVENYINSDTVALPNGTCVSMVPVTAPSLGPLTVKRSTTTPDAYLLGVVINAPTGGVPPGGVVPVITHGFALALFGATTTAGHYGLQGTATAGTLIDSATATNALSLGVILSSVTISSGTALVPIWINRT